jgi:hypothetical protein
MTESSARTSAWSWLHITGNNSELVRVSVCAAIHCPASQAAVPFFRLLFEYARMSDVAFPSNLHIPQSMQEFLTCIAVVRVVV